MGAQDWANILRVVGFPLMLYGMFALFSWNDRTRPGGAEPRSVARALLSSDQPKPRTRVLVAWLAGMACVLISLPLGIWA